MTNNCIQSVFKCDSFYDTLNTEIKSTIITINKEFPVETLPESKIFTSTELLTPDYICTVIDHTLLRADATEAEIRQLCQEASNYRFTAVCVNSSRIKLCSDILKDSQVLPTCVIGFPLGATNIQTKQFEAQIACKDGAKEISLVINIGKLKENDYNYIFEEISTIVKTCKHIPVKVIIEVSFLTLEQKIAACVCSKKAGAAFVETSTGFGTHGATIKDVALIKKVVGSMGVKASGEIRTLENLEKMVWAGADRVGLGRSIDVFWEAKERINSKKTEYL
ncbi:hypothetical protein PCANB_000738 [Pneumocystis canis]|nr:hypothetical protein PCK1_000633 [Pneumocystis canis]KAG5437701.1 hypothetical protein PCANB_000738 [Pneumocystis canis]